MDCALRRNVRATLNASLAVRGTDRSGKPLKVEAKALDFSRRGLGILVPGDVLATGAVVTVGVPQRFRSSAAVQWVRPDPETGQVRVGLRLINPTASLGVRIVAGVLLCIAVLAQASLARERGGSRPNRACATSMARMKDVRETRLMTHRGAPASEMADIRAERQEAGRGQSAMQGGSWEFERDGKQRTQPSDGQVSLYHAPHNAALNAAIVDAERSLALVQ